MTEELIFDGAPNYENTCSLVTFFGPDIDFSLKSNRDDPLEGFFFRFISLAISVFDILEEFLIALLGKLVKWFPSEMKSV